MNVRGAASGRRVAVSIFAASGRVSERAADGTLADLYGEPHGLSRRKQGFETPTGRQLSLRYLIKFAESHLRQRSYQRVLDAPLRGPARPAFPVADAALSNA